MQLTAAAKGCMNGVLFPLKFPNICGIYDMYIVTESTVPHHPKIFKFFSLIFSPVKTFAGTYSEASSQVATFEKVFSRARASQRARKREVSIGAHGT